MPLRKSLRLKVFLWLQRRGWHMVRVSPTDPIPDTRSLAEIDDRMYALDGVDMRGSAQIELLSNFMASRAELVALHIPPSFGAVDMEILYCFIRRYSPKLFVEVMSGTSTRVASTAMGQNAVGEDVAPAIIVLDPDASANLATDPRIETRREDVRSIPVSFFKQLAANDILFIDTSHVLKTGSDVQHLILEVLPSLPVGVLIHVHDIFLPREYPAAWFEQLRFANEQYMLQAFLAFNDSFEVLWSSAYMHRHHSDLLTGVFVSYDAGAERQGASLWLRRTR